MRYGGVRRSGGAGGGGDADGGSPEANVHATAAQGVEGGGGSLPHLDRIQRSFGDHDLSGVRAHTGGAATQATQNLGAHAYTMGDSVVLGPSADLHTVAHEAAHVVQQRGGAQVPGGVGSPGDTHERHADLVADRVTRGESAADLLGGYANPGQAGGAVQRQAVQCEHFRAESSPESVKILQDVLTNDNVHNMRALLRAMRQVAAKRIASGAGLEHIFCLGGGDTFDLHLTDADSDKMQARLSSRITAMEMAAQDSAIAAARGECEEGELHSEPSEFATRFNSRFKQILPGLRESSRNSGGTDPRSSWLVDKELNLLFTPNQRAKLEDYFATDVIPDRLFDGDELGGGNAQQRIIISGFILANGIYEPGTFSQRLFARYCGHFVELVKHYAGVARTGVSGVEGQFDHDGQLVLGAGGLDTIHSGAAHDIGANPKTGKPRYRREGLPFSEFGTIQTGDWLYIRTDNSTASGDHSVVFSNWVSDVQNVGGVEFRAAITFEQADRDDGAKQFTRYLGETRGSADGRSIYTISKVFRHDAEDASPQTAEDVIETDLQLDVDKLAGSELMPELGTGPSAKKNFELIKKMEKKHKGRVNLGHVKQHIRGLNASMLGRLATSQNLHGDDRMTDGQEMLLGAVNQHDDVEVLVRLNERLNNIVQNLAGLEAAEQKQSDEVEPEHKKEAAELEADRLAIVSEISLVEGEIDRAADVMELGESIRLIERDIESCRRSNRYLKKLLKKTKNESAKERLQGSIDGNLIIIEDYENRLDPLREEHAAAVAAEKEGRHTNGLGSKMVYRKSNLVRRLGRLKKDLDEAERAGPHHMSHPGGKAVFRGTNDDKVNGRLEDVRPEIDWAAFITPGLPGAAQEALDARNAADKARRKAKKKKK